MKKYLLIICLALAWTIGSRAEGIHISESDYKTGVQMEGRTGMEFHVKVTFNGYKGEKCHCLATYHLEDGTLLAFTEDGKRFEDADTFEPSSDVSTFSQDVFIPYKNFPKLRRMYRQITFYDPQGRPRATSKSGMFTVPQ